MSGLPDGPFNLPPGVSLEDIEGTPEEPGDDDPSLYEWGEDEDRHDG
jgi:hypothetical protein